MSQVLLWQDDVQVNLDCEEHLITNGISGICNIDSFLYVISNGDNTLHAGQILNQDGQLSVKLEPSCIQAIDVASTQDKNLLYVTPDGRVYSTKSNRLDCVDSREEIILEEEASCCAHGYSTPKQRVRVKSVSATNEGILFVTQNGHLWAQGNLPQIDIKPSDGIKRVSYFQGRCVAAVECGSNFSIALVKRKLVNNINHINNTDSHNEENEDVFVYDCPRCISESSVSLLSHHSMSDICPLGLPVRKFSVDNSTSSTTSKGNYDKKSIDGTTSPSTEDEVLHQCHTCTSKSEISDDVSSPKTILEGETLSREVKSEENKDKLNESGAEGEKRNGTFLNTEVARQFLTRQLSWVSSYGNAGEEFLAEYTEGTTRIVRQNVSNVANLVYEGVRTVGDKVATLSRHVSGGSDSCTGNEDSFEELSLEALPVASFLRFEDFLATSSAGTSDHEGEGGGEKLDPSIGCEMGANILATELYSWGNVGHGQLGIGDCMKRERPTLVARLPGTGVQVVKCGLNHAVALTLDGRMFAWGANSLGQVDWQSTTSLSSPCQVLCGSVGTGSDRTWDIACGARHTLMLTQGGDVFFFGKHNNKSTQPGVGPVNLPIPHPVPLEEGVVAQKHLLAHGTLSWCSVHATPASPAIQDLALEQAFLEECLLVHTSLVRPFMKKMGAGGSADEQYMYGILCQRYSDVVSFTALNTYSLWEFAKNGHDASTIAMVKNVDEHILVYKKYLEAACNVMSVGGFTFLSSVVEPSPRVTELFADRLPPTGPLKKGMKRNPHEATFACALFHPLSRLNVYKCILQSLMRYNHNLASEHLSSEVQKKMQVAFSKWESLCEESDYRRREADNTRRFWENAGRLVDTVRIPVRRLVRESRAHPIQVVNSGRFSSHWIVLFSDVLVHVAGSVHTLHPLSTLWVESVPDEDNEQHILLLITPEETLHLHTITLQDKAEWFQAIQGAIRACVTKPHSQLSASAARHAAYTFSKPGPFKDAKYVGRWVNGKMQGWGRLEWPDGKTYMGQFLNNLQHGYGHQDLPSGDQYEGQWREGYQNGRGILKYGGGDVYDGYFKDGLPHGHGTRKEGHFTASVASLYIGEWANGVKQGYGVMDNIFTGEKYLGCWSNNMKHGCGLIVTLDGIYYEGVFMQDTLTGHGVMVFEDGTHYEGEFKSAGCFNGKGTLTLNTGDRLEGSLQGMWNEGIKFAGTLFKNSSVSTSLPSSDRAGSKPNSFGKLCVPPNQKWKAIFRQCLTPLSVPSTIIETIASGSKAIGKPESNGVSVPSLDLQRLWSSVAVQINTSLQESAAAARAHSKIRMHDSLTDLDTIPMWGRDKLDKSSYHKMHHYLVKAFESPHHPLGMLLAELTAAYTATYGGVRVHPLLLSHAVAELHSLVARIYEVVRLLFPALPQYGQEFLLSTSPCSDQHENDEEKIPDDGEVVSASALLHPFVLPRVHAALFVLYALHNKAEDDAYWKRLLKWNKQPDMTLLAFLGIDQKFWVHYSSEPSNSAYSSKGPKPPFSPSREQLFTEAVETLQQLKTTFSPLEKLLVIRSTFEQLTQAVKRDMGAEYLWTMDELFPVFHFVVVRSRILQLGSEIHFVEDFMERHLQNGELGIMFTTLKACYYQILQEKISLSN